MVVKWMRMWQNIQHKKISNFIQSSLSTPEGLFSNNLIRFNHSIINCWFSPKKKTEKLFQISTIISCSYSKNPWWKFYFSFSYISYCYVTEPKKTFPSIFLVCLNNIRIWFRELSLVIFVCQVYLLYIHGNKTVHIHMTILKYFYSMIM
jgi:hypothetical protein